MNPSPQNHHLLPAWTDVQKTFHNTNAENAYNAYVGWENTANGDCGIDTLYNKATIDSISRAITEALEGVDKNRRHIVVPEETIVGVLSNMYRNATRPNIGDIYTRYVIPQNELRCDDRSIINQTINVIVRTIRDEIETTENNQKLSVWTTVLGDFNKEGLRSHAPIKIRRKHPQYMAFNMNY